ncbi:uncharacterized protein LOC122245086, partial [Penaeus japonicus]|uniref:uncharacterized protein LOC122245086 n=1 Tax=Penaeus japonicus TaxID=27405 RepID=UPI001C7142BE
AMETPCTVTEAKSCYRALRSILRGNVSDDTLPDLWEDCQYVCEEDTYSTYSSTNDFIIFSALEDFLQLSDKLQGNASLAVVNIQHARMQYSELLVWTENGLDLLGKIGGTMGLYLGCSIISLSEMVVLVFWCLCCCPWKRSSGTHVVRPNAS